MNEERISEDLFDYNVGKVYEALFGEKYIEEESEVGKLTGLYYKSAFFEKARKFLDGQSLEQEFCLVVVDIEHFKLFNEWHGREAGDKFLLAIAHELDKICRDNAGVAGYLGEDDFVILVSRSRDLLENMQYNIIGRVREYEESAGFLPGFGVYFVEDRSISINMMYDRARIALSKIRGNYAKRMNFYEHGMMLKMEADHHLLCAVPKALFGREFIFYLQPKCNMTTGKIVGAEALVRWRKSDGTMVPPNEFIPVLEQNGFVTSLDKYIWEEVCHFLRGLIDRGIRPVPISINVSRIDIYSMNVPEYIGELLRTYRIDPKLLEVEITEGAYTEKLDTINRMVEDIQNRGMNVLMDDFGSGYSSLNMLNDVNVDVLKLDMKFLDISEKAMGKGIGILEAVVNMARMMGMKVIVEGVETREQVDFLVGMGCEYAQGYFFFKPVTTDVFEELLKERQLFDYSGIRIKKNKRFQMRELLNENLFSETIVNNILGAIFFADYKNGYLKIVRTNEKFQMMFREIDDSENSYDFPLERIYEDDRRKFIDMFNNAYEHYLDGAVCEVRYLKSENEICWYRFRVFFLRDHEDNMMYYGSVEDIGREKDREMEFSVVEKQLSNTLKLAGKNGIDWNIKEDTLLMVNSSCTDKMKKFDSVFEMENVSIPNYSKTFMIGMGEKIANAKEFRLFINKIVNDKSRVVRSIELNLVNNDGESIWLELTCEPVLDINNRVVHIIGTYSDITEYKYRKI